MTPLSFEALPPEILAAVCDILASEHLPTLQALSLANKNCCAVANPYRFQNIHLTVVAEDRFIVDIQHWQRVLEKINGFHSVRRLSVDGHPLGPRHQRLKHCGDTNVPHGFQTSFTAEDEWTEFGRQYIDLFLPRAVYIFDDGVEDLNITIPAEFDAWQPFSYFVQKLRGLKNLVWLNISQFPPCLLDVLHRDLPGCRLHIRGFKFDSLYSQSKEPYVIDAHESALATSPSLASVVCTLRGDQSSCVQNEAAIMQMAAGAAPNLADIYIQQSNEFYEIIPIQALPQDLFVGCSKRASILESLRLDDPDSDNIRRWSLHVPFSKLDLLQVETTNNFTVLSTVAEHGFANLQSLILRLNISLDFDGRFDRVVRLDHDASILLSRLPPLKRLLLTCYYTNECVKTALKYHGKTLQKLGVIFLNRDDHFRVRTTPELIDEIRDCCPNLQGLTIRIPRSKGDAAEVRIYRALGNISYLRRLNLELDCSGVWLVWPVSDTASNGSSVDGLDPKAALINAAVDESLVRAILALVAAPGSSLRSLKVKTELGHMPPGLEVIAEMMQSAWEVDRFVGGVFVHRADECKKQREMRMEREDAESRFIETASQQAKPFRDLWPAKGGSWVDDWHSFPLQLD
ncbi:hypothetical protein BJY01DRAFT_183388 [Aspergillus pseudoustus]|uniref:F-box domain-containing protein n=1 Tax=Aspergillus pseudoustus TaxID=1810923 RepID=A0ABR4JZ29_9EURO